MIITTTTAITMVVVMRDVLNYRKKKFNNEICQVNLRNAHNSQLL